MIQKGTFHYTPNNQNKPTKAYVRLIVMLFFVSSFAQTTTKIPLLDVLLDIEKKFQYKFTFADDTIEYVYASPLSDDLSFEQTLEVLREKTGLVFSLLANNFVAIQKKKEVHLICGVVKDQSTELPLEGVTIQGENNSSITTASGSFELEVENLNETILIGHLGYKSVYKRAKFLKREECPVLFMDLKTEELDEVLIGTYITKGITKTKDGSFEIDYEDFGILPGLLETDVLQTIQALPGIQSADETVSNINIRGGTHDQNLILWDGIKMYQSGHFFGLISAINPLITGKATLIKNGTNPEFTDGVSGTIIMNTDTDVNTDFKVDVGVNMINADGFVDVPLGAKSSLQLTSRKSIQELGETPTYTQYFDRISQDSEVERQQGLSSDIGFDFYDFNLRWQYDVTTKDQIRVNFLTINNELVFTENQDTDTRRQSRRSSLTQNSIAGGVWYQRNWSDNLRSVIQAYETDYSLKSINANLEENQRFLQENVVSETGIKTKVYLDINDKMLLLNGYQFIETGVSNLNDIDQPVFIEKRNRVIRTHSFFSQLQYQPKKTSTLHLGMRYTYNDKFSTHFIEPRFSYNQKLFTYFNVQLLAEMKHQNTSQIINFQNDFLGIEKRRWILANNEDIPVIKGQQVSLGLQYNKRGWLVNLEGYYKNVEGITARSQGFQNQYEFRRAIGDYVVNGFDFLLNKRFEKLSAWVSYSYVKNDYNFDTFDERSFPNNIEIKHSLTTGASYTYKNLKVSTGVNWNSGLPTTRPVSNIPLADGGIDFEDANSSRLDEYLRVDLSVTYDFKISRKIKARAGFSVWNLTNHDNIINEFYNSFNEGVPEKEEVSSLDLTPNALLRISF